MTISKGWFISLGVVALLACNTIYPGEGEFTFSLKPDSIQPGQHATLEIRLPLAASGRTKKQTDNEHILVRDQLFVDSPQFQILETSHSKDNGVAIWRYRVTAYLPGQITLPPIELELGPHSFSTESITLPVTTTRAQGDFGIRKGFDLEELPFRLPRWLKTLVILLLMTAILTPIVWQLIKRYWPKPTSTPPLYEPTPFPSESDSAWLRRKLRAFRRQLEEPEEEDAWVDELTFIIKKYYSRRHEFRVEALTTQEFATKLPNEHAVSRIVSIFQRCDDFKFSGERTSPKALAMNCLDDCEQALLSCS